MKHWLAVAALAGVAFFLRTWAPYDQVFDAGLVNFQESDAWFHVRVIKDLVRHFPVRMAYDPDALYGGPHRVDTGPFFDYVPATLGWLTRAGEGTVEQMAAWYPAVLGALIIPVVFLTARVLYGPAGALCAAAIAATLPGQFLLVSSLGFTDHHVMESLLSTVVLWSLLRAMAEPARASLTVWSGLALAAYLLTFNGGAFLVAVIVAWSFIELLRDPAFPLRPVCGTLLIAAPFALSQIRLLWFGYSVAATLAGAAGLWGTAWWRTWCRKQKHPILLFSAGIALAVALGALVGYGVDDQLFDNVLRMTAQSPEAATVWELRSLTRWKGYFSLEEAWNQYGGALVFALMALLVLGERTWKRPRRSHNLLFVWSAVMALMALSQVRMGYYFAVAAALLCGYLAAELFTMRGRQRWVALGLMAALTLPVNVPRAMAQGSRANGVSADWFEALRWLREHTPEPHPQRYGVLAWWDYGYWITSIAQRIPVANPTQSGAERAADFLLAADEKQATEALSRAGAKYVIADSRIPFLRDGDSFSGTFLALFAFTHHHRQSDSVVMYKGRPYFRPDYFRAMAVRLYLGGNAGLTATAFAVLHPRNGVEDFPTLQRAQEAEAICRNEGCVLVSADPMQPCVDVPPLPFLQAVGVGPTTVKIFEVRD